MRWENTSPVYVEKMKLKKKRWVYMRSISSAASIFIPHSQGIGKERKRERKRREENTYTNRHK